MSLPLLDYSPISQNQRVDGFEVPSDEQPRIFTTENLPSPNEIATIIDAAYLQIYHEQQMLAASRQATLESQLKARQITVKDFIRGLILSDSFRRLNYDANNNYRFVELCFQRVLGRQVYNERETLAWSIVLATKGLQGFIDELLNTDEYLENFGEDTVPYQRRRILPQQEIGELTFAHVTRFGEEFRDSIARTSRSSSVARRSSAPARSSAPSRSSTPSRSTSPASSSSEGSDSLASLIVPILIGLGALSGVIIASFVIGS